MVLLDRLGMNFPRYVTMPKRLRIAVALLCSLGSSSYIWLLPCQGRVLTRLCLVCVQHLVKLELAFGFVEFEVALAGTF